MGKGPAGLNISALDAVWRLMRGNEKHCTAQSCTFVLEDGSFISGTHQEVVHKTDR